jgi:hypothetical protein
MIKMYKFFMLLCMLVLTLTAQAQATIYYVTPEGNDSNDGTSWETAKATVGGALAVKTTFTAGDEIWVKKGVYNTSFFGTKANVALYGGFLGAETDRSQRPTWPLLSDLTEGNLSVLDARLHSGTNSPIMENSTSTTVDGFAFINNVCTAHSGAMILTANNTTPVIRNCLVANNESQTTNTGLGGGGIYVNNSSGINATISHCRVINNRTTGAGQGGGIFTRDGSGGTVTIEDSEISGNSSVNNGGGIWASRGTVTIRNCIITGNKAVNGGGVHANRATPTIINSVIANNTATGTGAGLCHNVNTTVYNSIFYNNKKGEDLANIGRTNGTLTISNSITDVAPEGTTSSPTIITDSTALFGENWAPAAGFAGINGGTSTGFTVPEKDIAGNTRVTDGAIDMGPYEAIQVEDANFAGTGVTINSRPAAGYYVYGTPVEVVFTVAAGAVPQVVLTGSKGYTVEPTGTDTYKAVFKLTTPSTITISANTPRVITLDASDHVTVLSYSGIQENNTYTVADGDDFTLSFTLATGYALKSVKVGEESLAVQSGDGYSFMLPNVSADQTVAILDSLIQWPVTAAVGDGIVESTIPTTVDYGTALTVSFKVAEGYHLPLVTLGNAYQAVGEPAEGLYTITLSNSVTASLAGISVAAYPNNVLPVEEDTYVGGGGGNTAETSTKANQSPILALRNTGAAAYQRRAYLQFDLTDDIRHLITTGRYKVSLQLVSDAAVSLGTTQLEIRTVPDDLPATADMTWAANEESGTNNVAKGELIIQSALTELSADTPALFDVTDYIVENAAQSSIRLMVNVFHDGTSVTANIYSKENIAGGGNTPNVEYVPQLVFEQLLDLEISADETATADDYTGGSIIFHSDDTSTGQLTGASGLTLANGGVVKIVKTFTVDKWYPIGFPFAINAISIEQGTTTRPGIIYDENNGDPVTTSPSNIGNATDDNFYAAAYDGAINKFTFTGSLAANTGYVVEFPSDLLGASGTVTVTFTSTPTPTLSSSGAAPASADGYTLIINPFVANTTSPAGGIDNYYQYNPATNCFEKLEKTTLDDDTALKPFGAIIAYKGDGSGLLSTISIYDDGYTGLPVVGKDPVVETHYYNLQGVRIPQPDGLQSSLYIAKNIYQSGRVESKIMLKK